jgi:hypothetical protein
MRVDKSLNKYQINHELEVNLSKKIITVQFLIYLKSKSNPLL